MLKEQVVHHVWVDHVGDKHLAGDLGRVEEFLQVVVLLSIHQIFIALLFRNKVNQVLSLSLRENLQFQGTKCKVIFDQVLTSDCRLDFAARASNTNQLEPRFHASPYRFASWCRRIRRGPTRTSLSSRSLLSSPCPF